MQELEQAGFSNVSCTVESYPCSIALNRWQEMIRNRFWSTFSAFSDTELEAACQSIAEQHVVDDQGRLSFQDRLLFITATK
jgi:hypothetical protein